MEINASCEACMLKREYERIGKLENKKLAKQYTGDIHKILADRCPDDSAPYIKYLFDKRFVELFGRDTEFSQIKRHYNDLVMKIEDSIENEINSSDDPLRSALIFSRIGNYIDFSAQTDVSEKEFLSLFDNERLNHIPEDTYDKFVKKCNEGRNFLILCDNCGEIVLDKILLRVIHRYFPNLKLYAMVRGAETLNDATMEDALYCGIDKEACVITNGAAVAATIPALLSEEAKNIMESADIILAKGQGNYEGLSGSGYLPDNIFYLFLCKCELFTARFNVPKFTGMFITEDM